MGRLLILLVLCLLARDRSPAPAAAPVPLADDFTLTAPSGVSQHRLKLVLPFAHVVANAHTPPLALAALPLIQEPYPPAAPIATLVALGSGAFAVAPALQDVADHYYERLRHRDPLGFFEESLAHYETSIHGYTAILRKREKVGGKLHDYEETRVVFHEGPFSVYMEWTEFARSKLDNFFSALKQPKRALYVDGENDGLVVVLLQKTGLTMTTKPDSSDAKNSSRFTIDQFGMQKGMERTVASMYKARERGQLHLRYVGETDKEPRLGNVPVYIFVRQPYVPLEEDGLNELIIYVDKENWLQVGSILRDSKGETIAEYFFRDIIVNPEFTPGQFTRAALEKK